MKYEVEIRDGLGWVSCEGDFTVTGFAEALGALLDDPGFVVGMPCLWDNRNATTSIHRKDVRAIGEIMARHAERRGAGRTALVAVDDVTFGMARMYTVVTEECRPNPFGVFRDLDEARRWLDEPLGGNR